MVDPRKERAGEPFDVAGARARHFGRGLSLSYREPLTIVRGEGPYLFDASGRRFLDGVNNVCHVGHCHPRVVAAAQEQIATLNTNTRYLNENLARYVQDLAATFPNPLSVVYLVCSGSEATDLALRLARTYTKARGVVALEAAYHGNTRAAIDVSHYKFAGPGGPGQPAETFVAPLPCTFRGTYRADDAGERYAEAIAEKAREAEESEHGLAACIVESMPGVAGQIVLPNGFLSRAYESIRDRGGVAIADEVQVGFGRCGEAFWAFEMQGVVPDIVVLGKPMGNGHPMAAVVTTPGISSAFDNGMEYFNTFGGNPVSCAIGRAVLQVIEEESLQEHARTVGAEILSRLETLETRSALVGDVRGRGLFIGIELIRNGDTLEPAADEAYEVVEGMKRRGVLLSVDGPLHNVIKFKPPMVFSRENARELCDGLEEEIARVEGGLR